MLFCIQASNPQVTEIYDSSVYDLSTAIESTFPMRTEKAIMVWNNIYIPLCYKYDISYMINDVIDMLKVLREKQEGKIVIHWLPDTFRSDWTIVWKDDTVDITSFWGNTVGNVSEMLNCQAIVSMNKIDFINEWKQLIYNILEGLNKCKYNENNLPDIRGLIDEYSLISGKGILYEQN
ncbi:hypothetical protein [Candidatus Galacturonibacter soehngenii]|uniref:Uncharacterized protein n=1 Tax=Candidatus Galacturonatibacter soehngenii TaxID=2307010 RepID=A0A7V7QK21_9FIRM|nr:hypothetical protein [Candidatus Galacturonibacter soehngenii]KAB1438069.1 hypothetical protein F7O84_10945 [Candidatus Galacturonibacter soehngenii]